MANYAFGNVPDGDQARNTLSRRVYDVLKNDILSGRLKAGERLVRKNIARRLGVSTIPVIEALYMLEIDGYVENRALAGCRVRTLTMDEIDNDLMLREALECQSARLCAVRAGEDELRQLLKKAMQVDRFVCADTPDQTLASNLHWEFHIELGSLSGHSVFAEMLGKVWFQRYMNLNSIKAIRFKQPPERWHQILVERIGRGDPDEAERAMREHVQYGRSDDREALKVYLQSVE